MKDVLNPQEVDARTLEVLRDVVGTVSHGNTTVSETLFRADQVLKARGSLNRAASNFALALRKAGGSQRSRPVPPHQAAGRSRQVTRAVCPSVHLGAQTPRGGLPASEPRCG